MIKTLNAGAIRVSQPDLATGLLNARNHGFAGLEFDPPQVIASDGDLGGVTLQAFGLSVEWRQDEAKFQDGLAKLPALADAAENIGCTRCATWVLPGHDERNFDQSTEFHIERFRPIAEILGERGISLGLEFIGPRHLRDMFVFPWIYTMGAMLELAHEIAPNVGLLLDVYHWHTSGGTVEEIERLRPQDVVLVHLNDAITGHARHELPDGTRALPGETGVVDVEGFLGALRKIGYTGPASCEPFSNALGELPDDDARLAKVSAAMDSVLKTR